MRKQPNHIYRIANVENGKTLSFGCPYPLRDMNIWPIGLICQVAHESLALNPEQIAGCTGNNPDFRSEFDYDKNMLFVYLDTELLFFIVEKRNLEVTKSSKCSEIIEK